MRGFTRRDCWVGGKGGDHMVVGSSEPSGYSAQSTAK